MVEGSQDNRGREGRDRLERTEDTEAVVEADQRMVSLHCLHRPHCLAVD